MHFRGHRQHRVAVLVQQVNAAEHGTEHYRRGPEPDAFAQRGERTQACSSNQHASAGDAGNGDAAVTTIDAAMPDAADPDAGTMPPPVLACGYTATCIMGSICNTTAPERSGRVAGVAADPNDDCTCLRYDPVSCLNHRLLALGQGHTCALVGDQVQCWGGNAQGALGNDVPDRSLLPIPVDGLAGLIR